MTRGRHDGSGAAGDPAPAAPDGTDDSAGSAQRAPASNNVRPWNMVSGTLALKIPSGDVSNRFWSRKIRSALLPTSMELVVLSRTSALAPLTVKLRII